VIIFDQLRPRTDDRRDTSDDRDALEADAGVFSAGLFFRRFSARRLAFFDQAAESQMPWPEIRLYANCDTGSLRLKGGKEPVPVLFLRLLWPFD
jgi:hypothetical protein